MYEFFHEEHADYFQALLEDRHVEFERHLDEDGSRPITLFGIHKRFRKDSDSCNYLTHAKFRNPMIANKMWRWGLVLFGIGIVLFALIGYLKSQ